MSPVGVRVQTRGDLEVIERRGVISGKVVTLLLLLYHKTAVAPLVSRVMVHGGKRRQVTYFLSV